MEFQSQIGFDFGPGMDEALRLTGHTVDFAGFVPRKIGGLRDHLCTTEGLKLNFVTQVDFDERVAR